MSPAYEKRAKARSLDNERRLMGETLDAFHRREHARPPTLAEIFAENQRNRERCPVTADIFEQPTVPSVVRSKNGKAETLEAT